MSRNYDEGESFAAGDEDIEVDEEALVKLQEVFDEASDDELAEREVLRTLYGEDLEIL